MVPVIFPTGVWCGNISHYNKPLVCGMQNREPFNIWPDLEQHNIDSSFMRDCIGETAGGMWSV
jgi:hypothetical protein